MRHNRSRLAPIHTGRGDRQRGGLGQGRSSHPSQGRKNASQATPVEEAKARQERSPVRVTTFTSKELVTHVTQLVDYFGAQAVDKDAKQTRAIIDEWLATEKGQALVNLSRTALTVPEAHKTLCEVVYGVNLISKGVHPHRVCTALCCDVLENVALKLGQLKHVRTLCTELMRSIYQDYDEERTHGFGGFLRATPYYEVARSLHQKVTKLVMERQALEKEEERAAQRCHIRKIVLERTSERWQNVLAKAVFRQWREIVYVIKRQRDILSGYLSRLRVISAGEVFRAWHCWVVREQLRKAQSAKEKHELEVQTLQNQVEDACETEANISEEMMQMNSQVAALKDKLVSTNMEIEAQKVPETMAMIRETCYALTNMGDVAFANTELVLSDIVNSPLLHKLALLYSADDEERTWAIFEADHLKAEREVHALHRQQRKEAEALWKKERRVEKQVYEKEKVVLQETVKKANEEIFIEKINEARAVKAAHEEIVAIIEERDKTLASSTAQELAQLQGQTEERWAEQDATLERTKTIQVGSEHHKRLQELHHDWRRHIQKLNSREFDEKTLNMALSKITKVPPDELVLRWVKFHLRRSMKGGPLALGGGMPFRRACLNFHEDLNDGQCYEMLQRRIAPKKSQRDILVDFAMKGEVEPQVRIDAVLKCAAALEPPAVMFITRAHILKGDTILNAAFLTRLMMTCSAMVLATPDSNKGNQAAGGSDAEAPSKAKDSDCSEDYASEERSEEEAEQNGGLLRSKQQDFAVLQSQWKIVRANVQRFMDWDSWVKLRADSSDKELRDMIGEIRSVTSKVADFYKSLQLLKAEAERSRTVWYAVYDHLNEFLWQLFSAKVLQEQEAPMGQQPQQSQGHAPFHLIDYRHERRFRDFTVLRPRCVGEIIQAMLRRDWRAKKEAEGLDADVAEEEEGIPELNKADLNKHKSEIERVLRKNFDQLLKIYRHYAARGEGNAQKMSLNEFWMFLNDCKLVGDSNKLLSKTDAEFVFSSTQSRFADEKGDSQHILRQQSRPGGRREAIEAYVRDGFVEISPPEWVETMIDVSLRMPMSTLAGTEEHADMFDNFVTNRSPCVAFEMLLKRHVFVHSCQKDLDSFRGELSLDQVQEVFQKHRHSLRRLFYHYATKPKGLGSDGDVIGEEPFIDESQWMSILTESRIITRKGDVRHDFAEELARNVFRDVQVRQVEEPSTEDGAATQDASMIYMEFLEALAVVASYKTLNPYITLEKKLEVFLVDALFPPQKKMALKPLKAHRKK